MLFRVFDQNKPVAPNTAILYPSDWDDWFKYETKFSLIIHTSDGRVVHAGSVKIAIRNQKERKTPIPSEFNFLGPEFTSLGQNENYYEAIHALGSQVSAEIFSALRDCAFDLSILEENKDDHVVSESLLRSIDIDRVRNRFNKLAHGDASLTSFNFSYILPAPDSVLPPLRLNFGVMPQSNPPTNIHVLIGRNGVGKTRLFRLMTHALRGDPEADVGKFEWHNTSGGSTFANVVSVAFSAFDPFEPLPDGALESGGINYSYVGLQQIRTPEKISASFGESASMPMPPKSHGQLADEFVESLKRCSSGPRVQRWHEAIETLATDQLFENAEISGLVAEGLPIDEVRVNQIFKKFSSGHKIVLLTVTKLVELVDERTLVLIDEPEAHLHPPLLSAFISALSLLLFKRNGVSVIVTHSPVVLQEVPKKCVWFISRSGAVTTAVRPESETYGENVSVLTREAFGLEVTHSGFHKMLIKKAQSAKSYEELVSSFDGELGAEARALARALIAGKSEGLNA